MGALRGLDGAIKVKDTIVGYIDTWNISINHGSAEVSALGDYWKEYIDTDADWSGSMSGSFDPEDKIQKDFVNTVLGASRGSFECIFMLSPTKAFKGNIYVTSISSTVARADKITVSFNFQGSGSLKIGTLSGGDFTDDNTNPEG